MVEYQAAYWKVNKLTIPLHNSNLVILYPRLVWPVGELTKASSFAYSLKEADHNLLQHSRNTRQ